MDEKSNEIPGVRELLNAFADLAGAVFTIDAMHTQHDTVQAILGRGADYVMTVKANSAAGPQSTSCSSLGGQLRPPPA